MKTSGVALAVFLVLTASFSQAQGVDPDGCCTAFTRRPIPRRLLVSFDGPGPYNRCSLPAVIFELKGGRRVCADPYEEWVMERIHDLPQTRFQ